MKTALRLVVPFLVLALSSMATAQPANVMTSAQSSLILTLHNTERARFGEQPLVWDEELAAGAREWAWELALSGRFEHSPPSLRHGAGENLFMGTAGAFPLESMMNAFLEERADFSPGDFPHVARDGNWHSVGHYTQIIWANTRRVGCAVARARGQEVMACRYSPAGNVFGQRVP